MNKLRLLASALISTCIIAACTPANKDTKAVVTDSTKVKVQDTSSSKADIIDMYASEHDAEFAVDAAEANLVLLTLNKTALAKSSNATVRTFAATMLAVNEKADAELKMIAQPKNIRLSDELPTAQPLLLQILNAKKGSAFDKNYATQISKNLSKMATMMKLQAIHGMDNDLTAFAKKTIPVLEKQFKDINRMKKGI